MHEVILVSRQKYCLLEAATEAPPELSQNHRQTFHVWCWAMCFSLAFLFSCWHRIGGMCVIGVWLSCLDKTLLNCCFGSSLMHELPLAASVVVGGGRSCWCSVLRVAMLAPERDTWQQRCLCWWLWKRPS